MKTYAILVLNDGETYTAAEGCSLVIITEEAYQLLDEGSSPKDLEAEDVIYEIGLNSIA